VLDLLPSIIVDFGNSRALHRQKARALSGRLQSWGLAAPPVGLNPGETQLKLQATRCVVGRRNSLVLMEDQFGFRRHGRLEFGSDFHRCSATHNALR
jgi:hypothetical protein